MIRLKTLQKIYSENQGAGTLYNSAGVVKRLLHLMTDRVLHGRSFFFSYQKSFALPDQSSHRESCGGTLVPRALYSIFNHRVAVGMPVAQRPPRRFAREIGVPGDGRG
jgi:hypothetical protein